MDQSTNHCRQEHHKVIARMQKMLPVVFVNLSKMRGELIQ